MNGGETHEAAAPNEQVTQSNPAITETDDLDGRALILLGVQQISSSFSYRAAEFAFPLYFVELYTNTLLPASLYGFLTTGSAILLSGSVGSLTDRFNTHRLPVARFYILVQKVLVIASYVLFYVLFSVDSLRQGAQNGGRGPSNDHPQRADVWGIFAIITFIGCFLILSNVGVSVTIERDWITSIAQGSSRRLTRLNAIMRRIDLLSKLLSPLLVSLLTTVTGYSLSCIILLAVTASTIIFELSFIGIVFRRFHVLGEEEAVHRREKTQRSQHSGTAPQDSPNFYPPRRILSSTRVANCRGALLHWCKLQYQDWRTFTAMPIFISSISISLLYMSVLSFDSTFIAYLKSDTDYSDAFIAGMRGLCVVTGLLGTFVSPYLVEKIGTVRTGSWSLWAELTPLSLCIVSLYQGADYRQRPAWNTALLFTGLALSRVGLWSFDLVQLNQNMLDLLHYVMTIIFNKPSQFDIPADISFGAIGLATILYVSIYARRQRGHLVHFEKIRIPFPFLKKVQ